MRDRARAHRVLETLLSQVVAAAAMALSLVSAGGDALRLLLRSLITERATPRTTHCRIRLRASRCWHKRFGVALPRSPKLHEYGAVRAEFQHASNFGEVND